ncbi:BTAD domain-containing putative transcriptional regulator [Rhizohabitans arisaemae]|uniref:BTAD domain-containing putative transcriptional regulator n=1 Tax=Rhizohabitans arisaemae TaxID=2720610 RepID=UPI0024B236CB|nr:BTAD domain-containing putative transcriptional regulator [Rhizohabitans arisaemae]
MRVGILGPLEVVAGGEKTDIGGVRLRTLLIRLALDPGRTVPADTLADAVWPDGGPGDWGNALQSLVARLRRALPAPRLLSAPGGYLLDLPADAVDARRFERLAGAGRRALRDGEPSAALHLLGEGLRLWRGEIPEEAPDAARRRLAELRLTAREDHAEAALAADRSDGLVATLAELASRHPFRERIRNLLILALHAEGRQAEALAAYAEFRAFLADELGAEPGPELRKAHLAVLRGETTAARPRGNLRPPLTGLIGRDEERARVHGLMAANRLVTLVGPGGVGKTRLATAVAADGADTAWLVELAPVSGPEAVAHAAAAALGVRGPGLPENPGAPVERLAQTLERLGDALLVLDNCEHVGDAAARLAVELLGRCPGLRVLATGREPLGVTGETVYAVPPLAPGFAARLFADRAVAVRSGLTLDPRLVEDVCRRLDGLPLAIELAAARLRSLPLDELAARLGDRFTLLARGDRAAEPRHRTLRAVVAWSWDLLDDGERLLARRLAAFPGDITVESAEAVAATTVDQLTSLADKSLLGFDGERYRMLETIRAYGLDELVRDGELTRVRAAHTAYYTGLAERAEPELRGAGQLPWIARLTAERDNLLGALRFACESGDTATAHRLCAALGTYWLVRGDHHTLATWTRRTLDLPGPAPLEAEAVTCALHLLATGTGADRVRRLLPHLDARHPTVALVEPVVTLVTGDPSAVAVVESRLSHPDPWTRSLARLLRATLYGDAGDLEAMRRDLHGAVSGFRAIGERCGLAWSLTSLADLRTTAGEFEDAVADLDEAVALLRELDPSDRAVPQRVWAADARARAGDADRASAELRELIGTESLSADQLVFARITLADLARRAGDLPESARQLDLARQAAGPHTGPPYRVLLECAAAELAMAGDDLTTAERHLAGVFDPASDARLTAALAAHLARLRARQRRPADAAELLGAAHALLGTLEALDSDLAATAPELRAELGEHAFEAAYGRGRGLSHADALALIETHLSRRGP